MIYVLLVQDQLPRSLRALGADWGLDTARLGRVRVNPERAHPEEVDEELRAMVYGYNWLDLDLYGLAESRLDAATRVSVET